MTNGRGKSDSKSNTAFLADVILTGDRIVVSEAVDDNIIAAVADRY
jgi:hypothetical protein